MSEESSRTRRSPIDGIDLNVLSLVLFGGFAGGLLLLLMGDGFFSHSSKLVCLAQASLFGMAAAGIGVFVLANTDLNNRYRLLFFALTCGLSFPIVFEAAQDLIRNRPATASAEQAKKDAKAATPNAAVEILTEAVSQQPASKVPPAAADALVAAQMATIDRLSSPQLETDAQIAGLRDLAAAAGRAGYVAPAQRAADELARIGNSTSGSIADEVRAAQSKVIKDWTGIDTDELAKPAESESQQTP